MAFGPEFIYGLQVAFNKKLPWGVSKIEGGENWLALRIAAREGEWLLFSWASGVLGCCLADGSSLSALKKGALARTPLIEALKSRLLKGRILAAKQINYDRVLEFECIRYVAAGIGVRYYLVLEATEPNGNFVLLDENRKIEELARHVTPDQNRYRTLLPGHIYVPPPAFEGFLASEVGDVSRESVSDIKGIGRPLSRLIASCWDSQPPPQWLEFLRLLYQESAAFPCWKIGKGYITRFPFTLKDGEPLGEDIFAAAREGLLVPLLGGARSRVFKELDQRIIRAVKSRERHLDGLLKRKQNNAEAETFRIKGELLFANLMNVPSRAEQVSFKDWESDRLIDIELDPNLSASRNAERYFKKYRKAKIDPVKLEEELSSLELSIKELMEQKELLENIEDMALLEEAAKDVIDWLSPRENIPKKGKKENSLPPFLKYEIMEHIVLVGLSARGNRYVTFKQAGSDDLWLHAHELPGAHVIIKGAKGREPLLNSDLLQFAASLAAFYSKAKHSSSVQIDFTERRYVRSVPGAAIALVTYVNPGTIRVEPAFWKDFLESNKKQPAGCIP